MPRAMRALMGLMSSGRLIPQATHMIAALRSAGTSEESLVLAGRNHVETHKDRARADSPWMCRLSGLLCGA